MTPDFLLTTLVVCLASGISVVYALSVAVGGGPRAMTWLRRTFAAGLGARLALERA